jgi:putative tryptophan/tyrosine transport system substrate-binding protein
MIEVRNQKSEVSKTLALRPLLLGLSLLSSLLLASCSSAQAQQSAQSVRIGYLTTQPTTLDSGRRQEIRRALHVFGYIEGQNISMEYRSAEGKPDRAPALAAELVNLKVDVILVAGGHAVILAAKNATKTIPIVMVGGGTDPVESGLIDSLARPGGNITGYINIAGYLGGKRLELLKDAISKLSRVAILYEANNRRNMFEFKEVLSTSARALNLTILRREVRDTNDFDRVFAAINKERPDGIFVLGGPLMNRTQERTAAFAIKSRLPSMYDNRDAVDVGGLLFYGADVMEGYERVASFVDKILKGRTPADLPVEQPTKFELVINLKTAKQIGLTIPPEVLAKANRLIK